MEHTVLNQITSELLCYIQNKMSINDHDFIVKTVVEFYSEQEIESAKKLLFKSCSETALRLITYRKDAAKLNCRDIISKMNEAGFQCPTFAAINIAKLPVVTSDAFSLAKLSKDLSSVLNIEEKVANSFSTLACLQHDFKVVLEKCTKIDVMSVELEKLTSAVDRRNGRRVIESDSSVPESNSPNSTIMAETTDDDTDDDVFETDAVHRNAIIVPADPIMNVSHKTDDVRTIPNNEPVYPVLRLNDRPPHLNEWMTEGGFKMVATSAQKKKHILSRTFVNTSRKNIGTSRGVLKTIVPQYHGNDRRHGGYSRKNNKMCDVFISRLVPETTVRDVNNFLKSRLNRHVKIEQLRTKFDEYSSFKLSVPEYLRTKVLDKHFWESDDIYVRNFVQKTRY